MGCLRRAICSVVLSSCRAGIPAALLCRLAELNLSLKLLPGLPARLTKQTQQRPVYLIAMILLGAGGLY